MIRDTVEEKIEEHELKLDPETGDLIIDLPPFVPPETEAEQVAEQLLQQQLEANKKAPPAIDDLEDAVEVDEVSGKIRLKLNVGDRIVIERSYGGKWLDTETYAITSLDPETGELRLMNHSLHQAARSNFITGYMNGYKFKIADKHAHVGKRTRGRPKGSRKKLHYEHALEQQPTQPNEPEKKRGRGRPPGSKNRDRATIAAEKAERQKKRFEKRAKRDARKKRTGR